MVHCVHYVLQTWIATRKNEPLRDIVWTFLLMTCDSWSKSIDDALSPPTTTSPTVHMKQSLMTTYHFKNSYWLTELSFYIPLDTK